MISDSVLNSSTIAGYCYSNDGIKCHSDNGIGCNSTTQYLCSTSDEISPKNVSYCISKDNITCI